MRDRSHSAARGQEGFTVIEVLVAVLVLTVGMITLLSAFDPARRLGTQAEERQAVSARADRELQRVQSLPWAQIALKATPTVNAGATAKDPTFYISNGPCVGTGPTSTPCYQWDWSTATSKEALVIDTTNGDAAANPQPWSTTITAATGSPTRLTGNIYHYVTWANDTECTAAACGGTSDYKRVTVAVSVTGLKTPVEVSALVTNPTAGTGGSIDPLTDSSVKCTDGNTPVSCIG
jgi:Tfp pilus assembly protein PilV